MIFQVACNVVKILKTTDQGRYPTYVTHNEAALEWVEMSSEPILFYYKHIVDSGLGWLIMMEK
ncbi:MAG: hypothetical protein ACAF41_33060 [Leptolyngbya sp. BL-A-14]